TARAIRRNMDVAYRIRPPAGRIRLPGREGGRPGGSRRGGLPDAPRVRQVLDQLPGGDHEDRLLDARRLELLAERDADLHVRIDARLDGEHPVEEPLRAIHERGVLLG